MKLKLIILYLLGFLLLDLEAAKPVKVAMRIVRDTASYGYFGNNAGESDTREHLVARTQPTNFSGPVQLGKLVGRCFNATLEKYHYMFCPFQNMTQHEISNRWNAYQGILGIWRNWIVQNGTFTSMLYTDGDRCGDTDRSVQVYLECGESNHLVNVTEPQRCHYTAVFKTKLVCHKDALLVYPRLNKEMQRRWDNLFTEFHNGDITEKGYEIRLQKLLQEAHLTDNRPAPKYDEKNETNNELATPGDYFSDLTTCNKEYKNLKEEIQQLNQELDSLKLIFDLSKVRSKTDKPLSKR